MRDDQDAAFGLGRKPRTGLLFIRFEFTPADRWNTTLSSQVSSTGSLAQSQSEPPLLVPLLRLFEVQGQ
jgi:hypothetical protein